MKYIYFILSVILGTVFLVAGGVLILASDASYIQIMLGIGVFILGGAIWDRLLAKTDNSRKIGKGQ